jgi:putative peptide zinc metalloprotease protein
MTEHARPLANPLLEISDFDSDASKPLVMCSVPDGNDGVRFALPVAYMELVREFDGVRTVDEAIDAFLQRKPGLYERDWLRRLVENSLLPKGILIHPDQDPALAGVSSQPKRAFLFIKLPIIPPHVVDPIARRLGFMFKAPALVLGLVLAVLSHAYVYGVLLTEQRVDFNQLDAAGILTVMLLSTLGTLCHEFGHASAAAHYGCRRMTIGWGVYIIYTVLWTNVSEAWKLPRRQRAVVDVGGVYFDSIFLLLTLALYMRTGQLVFLLAFVFIDLSIARTFNPFLRMDGYWLMSDFFGIVNLRKQQMLWLQHLGGKLFGAREPGPKIDLSRQAKWALGIYTALGTLFLVYLLKMIFQFVILSIAKEYPTLLREFVQAAGNGAPLLELLKAFLEVFWRSLLLAGAAVTLWSMARSAVNLLGKLWAFRAQVVHSGT